MGLPFGPTLANIIMTEFENVIIKPQITTGTIAFYKRYIIDTIAAAYRKQTHTGQYQHFSSYAPWSRKIAWIRALIHRAHKICSNNDLLQKEIHTIKCFMSWNGYPRRLATKRISLFSPASST